MCPGTDWKKANMKCVLKLIRLSCGRHLNHVSASKMTIILYEEAVTKIPNVCKKMRLKIYRSSIYSFKKIPFLFIPSICFCRQLLSAQHLL